MIYFDEYNLYFKYIAIFTKGHKSGAISSNTPRENTSHRLTLKRVKLFTMKSSWKIRFLSSMKQTVVVMSKTLATHFKWTATRTQDPVYAHIISTSSISLKIILIMNWSYGKCYHMMSHNNWYHLMSFKKKSDIIWWYQISI